MEKPWKVISNAHGINDDFETLDEALKAADETLSLWRDQARDEGEWDEEVEGVEIRLLTHAARITNREGDNEDDGVDYGITEILGNEIDEELRQLRKKVETMRIVLAPLSVKANITEEKLISLLAEAEASLSV